jgi:nitrate/TMAO reductase-like tetraheme cytochrome c subunit
MISRMLKWFWQPTARYTWGGIFIVGGIAGIIFWGGFNTAMEATNTMEFCVSCHEMEENVYTEYKETIHFQNRTGVRATCSDCHVPDPWVHKVVRKIQASNELLHKALGTIDTPEKFEDKRLTLAKNVWKAMKESDSRECRNCHSWEAMSSTLQKRRAQKRHISARQDNMTCIDCHKGIAHRPVHKLLDEDDDPYDGVADNRRLPSKAEEARVKAEKEAKLAAAAAAAEKAAAEAKARAEAEAAAAAEAAKKEAAEKSVVKAAPAAAGGGDGGDWSAVPGTEIVLLYPGQASIEWIYNGKDHGGARAVRKINDRCRECHKDEEAAMGAKIVSGEKAESTPIPGKRGSIPVNVKAKHDGENMTLRFEWPDAGHTPVPFADGGKMDPENQIKLAVMFDDEAVEMAGFTGCWATCHHDSRYMPDAPKADALAAAGALGDVINLKEGVTKYLPDSRSEFEYKGKNGKPRGAWDKLIEKADMDALREQGAYMDLMRFKSGSEKAESGSILAERLLKYADNLSASGSLKDGKWTVIITRPLKADKPGGVSIEAGKTYTMGFAIHDDYTSARFHHVSLEYKLELDNPEAEINVVKQ